ncbi:right-handed parallel beta-helix repeat-containing protein [Luteolibacter marinus]|uniref:right-handed parallel beta-helix repeat-containing protein n=1 Tax=Luteolibacter marinus TaxID=2776705 RepID=UPI00186889FF|nr:right-handed parallel beta-helix repeat-containing protein [Luteolibacter marinus]
MIFRTAFSPLLPLLVGSAVCRAGDIYVDINHPGGSGTGDDWSSPVIKLQDALDEASAGATLHIAGGIYYPDEGRARTGDDASETFILKSGITLLGGYEPSGTTRQRDPVAYPTILSGDITQTRDTNGDGFVDLITSPGMSSRVVTASGLAVGPTLDGIGITGGNILGIDCTGSDLEMRNCVLRGNNGRAVAVSDASLTPSFEVVASDCLFRDNGSGQAGSSGGGLLVVGMNATITGCDFLNNRDGLTQGGGLSLQTSADSTAVTGALIRNCRLKGNRGTNGGGASVRGRASCTFENCVISGNRAGNPGVASSGGGVHQTSLVNSSSQAVAGSITFLNCTIAWNTAFTGGGGISMTGPAPKSLLNTIVFRNYVQNDYTDQVSGIWVISPASAPYYDHVYDTAVGHPGSGNIEGLLTGFPTFVEPVTLSTAPGDTLFQPSTSGNLRLLSGAYLIDSAENSWVSPGVTDLAGNGRIQNGTVDFGAYEIVPDPGIRITLVQQVSSPTGPRIRIEFESGGPVDVFASNALTGFGTTPVAVNRTDFYEAAISQSRRFFVLVPAGTTP